MFGNAAFDQHTNAEELRVLPTLQERSPGNPVFDSQVQENLIVLDSSDGREMTGFSF
jgi:hypothetical protein